jgi:hypothetical protein
VLKIPSLYLENVIVYDRNPPYNILKTTKTTASDRNTKLPSILTPELAFVVVVEAALPVPVLLPVVVVPIATTFPLPVAVALAATTGGTVPIDCVSAEAAFASKATGVIVLVYPGNKDKVQTDDGSSVKAFPA